MISIENTDGPWGGYDGLVVAAAVILYVTAAPWWFRVARKLIQNYGPRAAEVCVRIGLIAMAAAATAAGASQLLYYFRNG